MKHESGQALLLLVMVMATIMIVVVTASYRSVNETKLAKIQEESVQVVAAADSGIEKGFKLPKNTETGLNILPFSDAFVGLVNLPGIDSLKSRVLIISGNQSEFSTPEVAADTQYVFYLSDYDEATNQFSNPFQNRKLNIYYGQSADQCSTMALELTVVSGTTSYTSKNYVSDTGRLLGPSTADNVEKASGNNTVDGVEFTCLAQIVLPDLSNPRLLFVRPIYSATRLGFRGFQNSAPSPPSAPFPAQGKIIQSEARSYSGVTKIVRVFQSHPQIPSGFFVTSY